MTPEEAVHGEPGRARHRVSLGPWVAGEIASHMADEGLEAGSKLPSEKQLAEDFDVSLRVIRDALRLLSSQGLIETSQGKRAVVANRPSKAVHEYMKYVTTADADAVADLIDLRIAIETRAVELAAERATDEDRATIRAASAALAESADEIEAYADADLQWHRAVIEAAHNTFFSGIYGALADVLRRHRIAGVIARRESGDSAQPTIDAHAAVEEAILAGDSEQARLAMVDHLSALRTFFEVGATDKG